MKNKEGDRKTIQQTESKLTAVDNFAKFIERLEEKDRGLENYLSSIFGNDDNSLVDYYFDHYGSHCFDRK